MKTNAEKSIRLFLCPGDSDILWEMGEIRPNSEESLEQTYERLADLAVTATNEVLEGSCDFCAEREMRGIPLREIPANRGDNK